jgi:D-lactate dehydrogenase (cytochrome)
MTSRMRAFPVAQGLAATRRNAAIKSSQCTTRWQSTTTTTTTATLPRQPPGPRSFWTTGRVLLFSTFTGTLTYLYGINDTSSSIRPSQPQPLPLPLSTYATLPVLEEAITELRAALGEDSISTDSEVLHNHGYSEWSSINISTLPVAVAYPKSTAEVALIAKCCTANRIPLIPYSGGSSLEANFSAPHGGISVDFAHMDNILALRPDDMDVTVQPAVGWMSLNEKIKESGLFFPVDPGPTAMIGGMVGTGCSGTNAVRYGTMRDWVINLTVVLPDGTVIKTRRRPRKTSAGYNLTSLFVGSEGTLGLVTEITLKLAVIPQQTSVAVCAFPSIRDCAATSAKVMRSGIPVAAMEIMDEVQMNVVNRAGATKKVWTETPTLFFKFSGTPAAVAEHVEQVRKISRAHRGGDFEFTTDAEEQKALWSARKESLWSMLALRKGDEEVWSTDVAVPMSRLAELVEISKKEMDELGLFASVLGHIGDGNFHESIMYNAKDPEERRKVEACVYRMVERALEMEGTCTGEHGVGIGKKESLVKELGVETIGVMQKLKSSLDPLWIMNPGERRLLVVGSEDVLTSPRRQDFRPADLVIVYLTQHTRFSHVNQNKHTPRKHSILFRS